MISCHLIMISFSQWSKVFNNNTQRSSTHLPTETHLQGESKLSKALVRLQMTATKSWIKLHVHQTLTVCVKFADMVTAPWLWVAPMWNGCSRKLRHSSAFLCLPWYHHLRNMWPRLDFLVSVSFYHHFAVESIAICVGLNFCWINLLQFHRSPIHRHFFYTLLTTEGWKR